MRPGLVIFDCDGVIVDTEAQANRTLARWLSEAGYAIDYATCRRRFVGRSLSSVQVEIEAEGHRLGFDLADRWYASLDQTFSAGVTAIAHIETLLEALRGAGLPWCVASSARVEKMHLTLGTTGLLPHFSEALFSASMVERGKPFPDLFLHAAGGMGHSPGSCVVIEDSVAGVKAARAAGMRALAYGADAEGDRAGLVAAGGELFDDMRQVARLIGIA